MQSQISVMNPLLGHRLYLCQGVDILPDGVNYRRFVPNESIQYYPLCDDFGPMNLSSVVQFIRQLDGELEMYPECVLLYSVELGERALTNGVFLLGAFMILHLKSSISEVKKSFSGLAPSLVTNYRDATFSHPDFGLTLEDCWRGIVKGMELGWIRAPSSIDNYEWGCMDVDEYAHYDDPINGDMHEVVPGKFLAFKGPADLGAHYYQDDPCGYRTFGPAYYADVFEDYKVTAVVRLNERRYDGQLFVERGMEFHELEFEDCTAPPPAVVEAFLRVADAAAGAVAVHCKAGLGRTGTLIAVYLMRRHGFTAREAMGWLRIMRPGSVIGEQQHYLCAAGADPSRAPPRARGAAADRESSSALAAEVAAGMKRRGSLRARGGAGSAAACARPSGCAE